jgi:hypothetical protein
VQRSPLLFVTPNNRTWPHRLVCSHRPSSHSEPGAEGVEVVCGALETVSTSGDRKPYRAEARTCTMRRMAYRSLSLCALSVQLGTFEPLAGWFGDKSGTSATNVVYQPGSCQPGGRELTNFIDRLAVDAWRCTDSSFPRLFMLLAINPARPVLFRILSWISVQQRLT